jgi:hypothetical protein
MDYPAGSYSPGNLLGEVQPQRASPLGIRMLGASSAPLLGAAALAKGMTLAGEPHLEHGYTLSPELHLLCHGNNTVSPPAR